MPKRTPGFVRDPDQAAELSALLADLADEEEADLTTRLRDGGLSRRAEERERQTIARYRRWAAELAPADDAEEFGGTAGGPVHIRPADTFTEEATG